MEYAKLTAKERQRLRSEEIRQHHDKLSSVREHGVKKYSDEYIYTVIARRWCLAIKTIEHIVYYRNGYN